MLTLVIGLPGSGKTTWVKNRIGDGLVYDLDYIAGAFRLTGPHEEDHIPSVGLANSMFYSFARISRKYSRNVYMIRTAPSVSDLIEIQPDKVVVCNGSYPPTGRKDWQSMGKAEVNQIRSKILSAVNYAVVNHIPVEVIDDDNGTMDKGTDKDRGVVEVLQEQTMDKVKDEDT